VWHALGRRERHTGFWWGNLKERDNWEYLRVDGKVYKDLQRTQCQGIGWIDLAQYREKRRAVVNTAINFREPYIVGNVTTS
jgi:hypothetical protein